MSWKMSVWLFAFVILFVGVIDFPAFAEEQPYPDISIREENDGSYVYWGNDMILELEQNRYIRFRATPADENWVGTERKGADLGWAFSDSLAEGFEVLSTNHLNSPETKEFTLNILGKKPNFDSEITICIKGIWLPEQAKFKYVYYTSLNCKLEDWYQNSIVAQNYYERNPNNTAPIEVTDYHIEYISATDRNQSINHREPQKYEYFVRSDDGVTWEKFPKIYVPYPTRDGNYITIRENGKRFQPGSYYGFLDRNYGGWLQKLNKSTTHVSLELCWYFFDLHILLQNVVPPRYSQEDFYAEMELEFLPVEASDANQIMDSAQELD